MCGHLYGINILGARCQRLRTDATRNTNLHTPLFSTQRVSMQQHQIIESLNEFVFNLFHFSIRYGSESSQFASTVLDYVQHWSWHWPLSAGCSTNSFVILCSDKSSHICTQCGMCWFSYRHTPLAFYLHTMRWKKNMQIAFPISDTGRSTNLNLEFHLFPSNATTMKRNVIYNWKVEHIAATMCKHFNDDKIIVRQIFNTFND